MTMTKEKIIQQVRNLHKSNIVIEKKEGLFGKQKFSLVVAEDGQTRKILQAHYKGGFWNTGCYRIVADAAIATTTISQENQSILLSKEDYELHNAGNLTSLTTNNLNSMTNSNSNSNITNHQDNDNDNDDNAGELISHYSNSNSNSGNHSLSFDSNISNSNSNSNHSSNNDVVPNEIENYVSNKTLNMFKKLKLKKKLEESNYITVGKIESSGLFFDTTIIHDDKGDSKGFVTYESTSRTGELMKLKIGLPIVHKEPITNVARIIALAANIPDELGHLIAGYVGNVYWSKSFKNLKLSNCPKLFKEDTSNLMKFCNKMPSWNPAIAAYTLEFCGRAILPSVHNFQLIDEEDNVVLQLGKVNETTFNMDFGYPLSAYQAFAICLSVIVRTFVWD